MIVIKSDILNSQDSVNEGLVLFEAFSGNANLAKVLYDKFNVNDITLSARLSYLSGEYEEALNLAKEAKDIYLQCEILITINQFSQALELLKNEPLDPVNYYHTGVIYLRTNEYKKSIACLEKAYEGFRNDSNDIRKLMTLSNLAVSYNSNAQIEKANSVFNTAAKLIKKSDQKRFPRLCSKFYVSYGCQLMQIGKLIPAYKYLKTAEKLINGNRSEEYFRCQVFIGYVTKQLGYYRKALSVLEKIQPTATYLNLDRLRYLAECYLNIGDTEKAKSTLERGFALSEQDKFSQIFLNLVSYQIQIAEDSSNHAQSTFSEIELLCNETKDEMSLDFALGKKAYLTNDVNLAREQIQKLQTTDFQVEALECSLVIAKKHISTGSFQKALVLINKLGFQFSPVQHIEALLLKALCYKLTDQKIHSHTSLESALLLTKMRSDDFLLAKCHLVQMHLCTRLSDIIISQKKYADIATRLEPWQIKNLKKFFASLNCRISFNIALEDKSVQLPLLEFAEQILVRNDLILDVENQSLVYHGRVFDSLRDFPVQWNLLKTLARCSSDRPLTKEMLVTQVLERPNYNPINDDNNANVTVHRLRKNLKKMLGIDLIVSRQGSYFLNSEYKVIILESLQAIKSLHVS
ncbi:MAG: hypothetical protein A4S09_10110 [Proteobacteria bacterium SG_bin7]|nr:MAG: hypothetical protein A4S09_10110 [Proteobacteria bacterium SG_bin7]